MLTGGFSNRKDVVVYSMSGQEEILPDLNTGRQYHACASYVDIYDEKVNNNNTGRVSSCEKLVLRPLTECYR